MSRGANPDRTALAAEVSGRFCTLFADAGTFLGPAGAGRVRSVLPSVSLRGPRQVEDLACLLVLADLAGRGDILLAGADALRAVPLTGDQSTYEPIRQIFCGAVRRAELDGVDPGPFRALMMAPEGAGPGDPVQDPLKSRVAGLLVRPPSKSAAATATSGSHHLRNVSADVLELYLMWAFGGSFRWSRKKIDAEIAAAGDILRRLGALL